MAKSVILMINIKQERIKYEFKERTLLKNRKIVFANVYNKVNIFQTCAMYLLAYVTLIGTKMPQSILILYVFMNSFYLFL